MLISRRSALGGLAASAILPTSVLASTPTALVTGFPHVYEYSNLNPNRYYWCGHAALASALAKSGKSTDIARLHTIFLQNSPAGYGSNRGGKYISAVQDLMWATDKQFGLELSQASLNRTSAELLGKVKDAVSFNRALIVPSDYGYVGIGHFWLIVGYKEVSNDPDQSIIYMRDMARPPNGTHWDHETKIGSFVHHTNFNNKMPYLIVKGPK